MKLIVRTFAIALALTSAVSVATPASAKATVAASHSSFMPVASCPPNDPNACGFK